MFVDVVVVVVVAGGFESRLVLLTEVGTEVAGDDGDLEAGEETDSDTAGTEGEEEGSTQRPEVLVVTSSSTRIFEASPRSLRDGVWSEFFSVAPARALATAEFGLGEASPATRARASCIVAETEGASGDRVCQTGGRKACVPR